MTSLASLSLVVYFSFLFAFLFFLIYLLVRCRISITLQEKVLIFFFCLFLLFHYLILIDYLISEVFDFDTFEFIDLDYTKKTAKKTVQNTQTVQNTPPKLDYRKYRNDEYWDNIRRKQEYARNYQLHPNLVSSVNYRNPEELAKVIHFALFHVRVKYKAFLLACTYLLTISISILGTYSTIELTIKNYWILNHSFKDKRDPYIFLLMHVVEAIVNFQRLPQYLIGLSAFVCASHNYWAPHILVFHELDCYIAIFNEVVGIDLPMTTPLLGRLGYNLFGLSVIGSLLLFVPKIALVLFSLITSTFYAPKLVDRMAGVLAILLLIFSITMNFLMIYIIFDATPYVPLLKLYRFIGFSICDLIGVERIEPLQYLPIFVTVNSFFQCWNNSEGITLYKIRPTNFKDAIDTLTRLYSFNHNINLMELLKEASFLTKLSSIRMVFDDKIMDVENLTPAQFSALLTQRIEFYYTLKLYSEEYNYFFKREKFEYYIDLLDLHHWTEEKKNSWIEKEDTFRRMEEARRRSEMLKKEKEEQKKKKQDSKNKKTE